MKKNIDINVLLKKYRIYLLPGALFLLSFLMVLFVIIPQFSSISENSSSITQQKTAISALQNSQKAIDDINHDAGPEGIQTVSTALPSEKDIVLIYSTVANLASKSNLKVKSFNVKVGNFYTKTIDPNAVSANGAANLKVQVSLQASDYKDVLKFSQDIYQALPVAEINTLQANIQDGTLDILFFYKPFNVATFARATSVAPLTPAEKDLLTKLFDWSKNSK